MERKGDEILQSPETEMAAAYYDATVRVLSDRPRGPVDAVFFPGRAAGDDSDDLFFEARSFVNSGMAPNIVINGGDGRGVESDEPKSAWPGRDEWTKRFSRIGIDGLLYTEGAPHTRAEADVFLDLAIENKWNMAAVLSHPHQSLRIMLGFVEAMKEKGYVIAVYTITPRTTDWSAEVLGSQGKMLRSRREHISEEFGRIGKYQAKGDVASFEELADYLDWRESLSTA